jgi:hypothetical protein
VGYFVAVFFFVNAVDDDFGRNVSGVLVLVVMIYLINGDPPLHNHNFNSQIFY